MAGPEVKKLTKEERFAQIYGELRQILVDERADLVVTDDADQCYTLTKADGEYMTAVQVKKNYVSFHLMPVYCDPSLLDDVTPELLKRMQGKSCFNFTQADPALFGELRALVARSLAV